MKPRPPARLIFFLFGPGKTLRIWPLRDSLAFLNFRLDLRARRDTPAYGSREFRA